MRRAHASQTGSSSGSSIVQPRAIGLHDREAEALANLADADRARLDVRLELLDGLLGPARTDVAEVDARQHPHAILVRRAAIVSSVRCSRSPDMLSALTISRTLRLSSDADEAGEALGASRAAPCGCPWKSIAGNFAFGTLCSAVTSVDFGR